MDRAAGRAPWRMVSALGVATIVSYGTTQYLFGAIVSRAGDDLGAAPGSLAISYAASIVIGAAANLVAGPFIDRFGARVVLSIGSFILGAAFLALAAVATPAAFVGVWAAGIGFGTGLTYYPVTFAVIARAFDAARPEAYARLTLFGAFASTAAFGGAALLAASSWRTSMLAAAAANLLVALPMHVAFVRHVPHGAPLAAAPESPSLSAREAFRSLRFWILTLAVGMALGASYALFAVHLAVAVRNGISAPTAAATAALLGIAFLPARAAYARLRRRIGAARVFAGASWLAAAAAVVLFADATTSGFVAYVLLFGAAFGLFAPLRGDMLATEVGHARYGTIAGVQNAAFGLLGAAGPAAAGALLLRPVASAAVIAGTYAAAGALALTLHRDAGAVP